MTIRPPKVGDAVALIAGHDDEARRWVGRADVDPQPIGCIVVDGEIVGWLDYDVDRDWLLPGEVNIGYVVFRGHRGAGYATRAVQLLMHHLAQRTQFHTATLLIHKENSRSLAVAERTAFVPSGDLDESRYFKRPVPPVTYTDGAVTLRRPEADDLDPDLDAKDDEQINWLWLPGEREHWESMSRAEQRAHALRGLEERRQAWGTGPKWTFTVDARDAAYVAYVDCDLSNDRVPAGEANISYSSHPAHRGKGHVRRAVLLMTRFLRENTGAREAHLLIDADNVASLRVARTVGAPERDRFVNEHGRAMVRHVIALRTL